MVARSKRGARTRDVALLVGPAGRNVGVPAYAAPSGSAAAKGAVVAAAAAAVGVPGRGAPAGRRAWPSTNVGGRGGGDTAAAVGITPSGANGIGAP